MLCISMVAGGYVLLATAGACAPPCHPAVDVADTWRHESAGGVSLQIVNTPAVDRLLRDGWRWVRVREDQRLLFCLSKTEGE